MFPISLVFSLFLSASAFVTAAPPGILKWQTLGSPTSCEDGTFLTTIGFVGNPDINCTGLADTDPTLLYLEYALDDSCSIQLYTDAACSNSTLQVDIVGATLNGLGVEEVFGLESMIPDNVALGTEECLQRCGLTLPETPTTNQRQPRVAGNAYPASLVGSSIPQPTVLSATGRR